MSAPHDSIASPAVRRATRPAPEVDAATLLSATPRTYLRRVPGRETFAWPDEGHTGAARVIVKRTHGSSRREDWYERLRGERPRSPGEREHANLAALAADGISVPHAIGWCDGRAAGSGSRDPRSVVVMELVEHEATLREAVAERAARAELASALLELVVRLHDRGWYHRDLYLQHVLVRAQHDGTGPELVLIDVGRARQERSPRPRWLVKDLASLAHSTPACVTARERLSFLARYLDRRGIRARSRRRAWLRAIERKRTRIAAHVPRFGEARQERDP